MDKLRVPRKAWPAIYAVLILWIAWMAAGIVDGLAAAALAPRADEAAPRTAAAPPVPMFPGPRDYAGILRANVFNSAAATDQLADEYRSLSAASLAAPGSMEAAPRTTLSLRLAGTFSDPSGRILLAVIEPRGGGEQRLYRLNEAVSGAKIVKIERRRIGLLNNGKLEILEMELETPRAAGPKLARESRAAAPGAEVVEQGEGNYVVSKRYLDEELTSMNRLLTEVRAVPHGDKGSGTAGFKLFDVKKGSLFAKIGLKNQDIVQRINGMDLTSAETGLEMFQAFRNDTKFEVDLVRNNEKKTLRFSVQ